MNLQIQKLINTPDKYNNSPIKIIPLVLSLYLTAGIDVLIGYNATSPYTNLINTIINNTNISIDAQIVILALLITPALTLIILYTLEKIASNYVNLPTILYQPKNDSSQLLQWDPTITDIIKNSTELQNMIKTFPNIQNLITFYQTAIHTISKDQTYFSKIRIQAIKLANVHIIIKNLIIQCFLKLKKIINTSNVINNNEVTKIITDYHKKIKQAVQYLIKNWTDQEKQLLHDSIKTILP